MKRQLLSLFCLICLAIGLAAPASALTVEEADSRLDAVISLIEKSALEYKGEDVLRAGLDRFFVQYPGAYEALMSAILTGYDSHSMYLSSEEYQSGFPSSTASYVGIGVTMRQTMSGVEITEINPNGPAKGSGLMAGDIIVAVDGVNVLTATPENVGILVKGDPDTQVKLTVLRGSMLFTFELTRRAIDSPNVSGYVAEEGVFYMKIARFADANSYIQFYNVYGEMIKAECRSLILDLRGNPGGEIAMAKRFIDLLIPDENKKFFSLVGRDGEEKLEEEFISNGIGPRLNKIVILTDDQSASCAEMMTSALHDLGYAVTVGQTTLGKARGQVHMKFDDSSAAVLTTTALVPPSGVDYEGKGLKPDYIVENTTAKHPAAACLRLTNSRLFLDGSGAQHDRLLAALKALEFIDKDYKADRFTPEMLEAVNSFRKALGYGPVSSVDMETIPLINEALDSLSDRRIDVDAQYERALTLARRYLKTSPLQYYVFEDGKFKNLR